MESNQPNRQAPLIALAEFIRSGRSPISMRWAVQVHGSEMEKAGVLIKYGNRWLISEPHLFEWIRSLSKRNP